MKIVVVVVGIPSLVQGRRSFVYSFFAGTEIFISVQCASPGGGGDLIGVCGVRAI